MNKLVSNEIKRLLFDKGWRYELSESYDPEQGGIKVNHSLAEQKWNEGNLTHVDITVDEIIMWLYEKHKIWIYVTIFQTETQFYCQSWIEIPYKETICVKTGKISHTPSAFDSITEAYEAAIEYTLKNLI